MNYLVLTFKGIQHHYPSTRILNNTVSGGYFKTERMPTRNAVIGMIGAVMGYKRNTEYPEDFRDDLDFKYRTTKEGSVFVDFQTVTGKDRRFRLTGGGSASKGIIKRIEYLQDYEFEVYVGGTDEQLKQVFDAFHNPVFDPYFGKCKCRPYAPIAGEWKTVSDTELEGMENVYNCP